MAPLMLARHAMATRFELVVHGDDPARLRAAGEEALDEVDRVERQLSLYQPSSEVAHLNARAAKEPVRVTPSLFALLRHAQTLSSETGGAFDITIAPLVKCWGFLHGRGQLPSAEEVAGARSLVGMHLVELDEEHLTVRFAREGVMLDFGAIGKGYAVERAIESLRENGISSALLHGGTSTVFALGHPPGAAFWTIAIDRPPGHQDPAHPLLASVLLRDEAMSVSAVWGKCFQAEGRILGHILDPRTGRPANGALLSAIILPSATETDALSTAALVLDQAAPESIRAFRPDMSLLLLREAGQRLTYSRFGLFMAQP